MKLIKNDYVIEGTPKEINEFLESEHEEKSSKVNDNCVSNKKFILTRDAYLFYKDPFNNPHNGRCNRYEHLPNRCFLALKDTILEHIDTEYHDSSGKRLNTPMPIFKDKDGVEVKIPFSDRADGVIKKIGTESLSDLMEKPLKDLIEMAKSVCEKGE